MQIFLHRGEKTEGPFTLETIKQALAQGSVALTDFVSYDGGSQQVPLILLPGLSEGVKTQPADSPSPQKSRTGCCGWIVILGLVVVVLGVIVGPEENAGTANAQRATDKLKNSAAQESTAAKFSKLALMTPVEAYEYGRSEMKSAAAKMIAYVTKELDPSSDMNQIRRQNGAAPLTSENYERELLGDFGVIDESTQALSFKRGREAGCSDEVISSYLRGLEAGGSEVRNSWKPPEKRSSGGYVGG